MDRLNEIIEILDGKIFSGKNTEELWLKVQSLDALSTGDDAREVIILLVELLQQLESKVDSK